MLTGRDKSVDGYIVYNYKQCSVSRTNFVCKVRCLFLGTRTWNNQRRFNAHAVSAPHNATTLPTATQPIWRIASGRTHAHTHNSNTHASTAQIRTTTSCTHVVHTTTVYWSEFVCAARRSRGAYASVCTLLPYAYVCSRVMCVLSQNQFGRPAFCSTHARGVSLCVRRRELGRHATHKWHTRVREITPAIAQRIMHIICVSFWFREAATTMTTTRSLNERLASVRRCG